MFKLILCTVPVVFLFVPTHARAGCPDYPTIAEIDQRLEQVAAQYPDICQLDVIGTSVNGRELHSLRIGASGNTAQPAPEIRITGGIHGDECQSVDEVLHIMDWLVEGVDTDTEIQKFVSDIAFYLIPLVNPDGYSADPATRENANDVDVNRNFGFAWSDTNLFLPFSEPESRAIRDFSQRHAFALGLSYHTEANYVNGPWNYTPFHPRDDDLIDAIGYDYAGASDYNVVFGWDWYQISGDVNDWSLGTMGTFDWTIELFDDSDLAWEVHEPALRAFFNWMYRGVEGTVTDAQTGESLHAMITIEPEGAPIFTHPERGYYRRILLDGTYEVTAWAPGYRPKTIENVVVENNLQTVDFTLTQDAGYTAGFQINGTTLPRDISNSYVSLVGYDNNTIASDALGTPDGFGYAVSAGGTITVDMGVLRPVMNGPGNDLRIVSATGSDDTVTVLVSMHQDGPFTDVASGSGNIEIDLNEAGLDRIRYVRLVDTTIGVTFNASGSGYDLDAVVNLSHARLHPDLSFPDTDSAAGNNDPSTGNSSSTDSTTSSAKAHSGASELAGCTHYSPVLTHSLFELLL